jgi:hypothetical protein
MILRKHWSGEIDKIYFYIIQRENKFDSRVRAASLRLKDELGEGRNILSLSLSLSRAFYLTVSFKTVSIASKAYFNKLKTKMFIIHVRTLCYTQPGPLPRRNFHTQRSAGKPGCLDEIIFDTNSK